MVQIPEYKERYIANPSRRGLINLQEPEAMRSTRRLEGTARALGSAMSDTADVMAKMKRDRDTAIVNEYMNKYTTDSAEQIAKLKQTYNGKNAQGIIKAYNDWQEQHLIDHMGLNGEDNEIALEDRYQVDEAKRQMRYQNSRMLNSLSAYAARELEGYKNTQFEARIQLESDALSKETDLNNMRNHANTIAYLYGQRYAGSPQEFLKVKTRDTLNNALAANIAHDMATNPTFALQKLSMKEFTDNIDVKTLDSLEQSAVQAYIKSSAQAQAEAQVNGYETSGVVDKDTYASIQPILKKYGEGDIANAIRDTASKKAALMQAQSDAETANANNTMVYQSDQFLKVLADPMATEDERADARNKIGNVMLPSATTGFDSVNIAVQMENIYTGAAEFERDDLAIRGLEDQVPNAHLVANDEMIEKISELTENPVYDRVLQSRQQILNDAPAVASMIERIENNDYKDITSFDLSSLHPVSAKKVIDALNENTSYGLFKRNLQARQGKSFDFDTKLKENYKKVTGVDAAVSPVLYGEFRRRFQDAAAVWYDTNKGSPTLNDFQQMTREVYADLANAAPAELKLLSLAGRETQIRKDLTNSNGFVSPSDLREQYLIELDSIDELDDLDDPTKERLADLLTYGNSNAALTLIRGMK